MQPDSPFLLSDFSKCSKLVLGGVEKISEPISLRLSVLLRLQGPRIQELHQPHHQSFLGLSCSEYIRCSSNYFTELRYEQNILWAYTYTLENCVLCSLAFAHTCDDICFEKRVN